MRAFLFTTPRPDSRWDSLKQLLVKLEPGDTVTVSGVMARTGLGVESVDTVLQALTRASLFARVDRTTFVRESLSKTSAIDMTNATK